MSKSKMDRGAELAHDVWAAWMKYMFNQGIFRPPGDKNRVWIMPPDKVERWARQMNTPFDKLPESERGSDYDIAKRFQEVFNESS